MAVKKRRDPGIAPSKTGEDGGILPGFEANGISRRPEVHDHIWSLKAMVFDRVPPWPQEQTVSNSLPGEERGMRGSVCAEAGQGAWTRAAKWVGRADHRLRDCSPTASEGSEIFIRKPEVRDPIAAT